MTILKSGNFRGFFNPVSLGLYAPTCFSKLYKNHDEISLEDWATFFHELSHYLQFYGSCFGYFYLYKTFFQSSILLNVLKEAKRNNKLICPVSMQNIKINKYLKTKEDIEDFPKMLIMNRYFQEEIYGWTYPLFITRPVHTGNYLALSTPLILEQADETNLPITGEMVLECQAASNEANYLANNAPSHIAKKIWERNYCSISKQVQNKYTGLSTWIATMGLLHLEDLIYFIILNQPIQGFLSKVGDYSLVRNIKKILINHTELENIERPRNDKELNNAITDICKIAQLNNPFSEIKKLRDFIQDNPTNSSYFPLVWVVKSILEWTLKNTYDAIKWYEDPNKIMKNIPICRIIFDDERDGREHFNLNFEKFKPSEDLMLQIKRLVEYGNKTYLINELFYKERISCPYIFNDRKEIHQNCEKCPGYIPNDIENLECPVANTLKELDLSMPKGEKNEK